jgi:hypothetical protein
MGIVAWGVVGASAAIGRFPSRAMGGSVHKRGDPDAGPVQDGGLWRGLEEASWIVHLLHGLPPPRDSAHSLVGPVAHR